MQVCDCSICTGCGVCADACPKKCIKIEYDNNGFLQSYVDEDKCISCGKCQKVCPALNPRTSNPISNAYKIRRKDNDAIINSTSGGVAALISEHIISNGGVVVGCGFDEKLVLKHSIAENSLELEKFKGSKYVQSNTAGIYRETESLLKTGKLVLFIGTPCQTSSLHNFLEKTYENLYVIDLICHGVSSQKILDKYIEKEIDEKIELVKFRNKDNGYKNCAKNELQFIYKDGIYSVPHNKGIVLWFASNLSTRESCYKCNFVNTKRSSDLTLADYNGADILEDDIKSGVSTVFVNTDKGACLLNEISNSANIEEKNLDACVKLYSRLHQHSRRPRVRDRFFAELNKKDIDKLAEKYCLKKILPSKIILYILAIKRKIKRLGGKNETK